MALTEIKTSGIADDAITTDKLANAINTERTANTAKTSLEDNAVTLAKMAGGTDGQIITYDASGDPVAVGPGTDGQVLTSTGAGSPPAFEAIPAAGAALTGSTNNTITTVTGSNAIQGEANLTFDGSQLGVGSSANYGTIGTAAAFQVQGTNTGSNTSINIVNAATSNASSTCDVNAWQDYRLSTRIISGRENASNWTSSSSAAASYLAFYTNSAGTVAERMRVKSDGDVEIKDGNLIIETAGHGINFHAHSGTANLLDDYEEGVWTPTVGTTSGTNTSGVYTKIGRLVHVKGFVSWSTHSNSGDVIFGGLPFTPSGSGYAYLGDSRWVNLDSNQYSLGMFFDSNGLNFKENGDNQNAENLIWSQLNNDTFMGFGGIYYVAAQTVSKS